MVNMIRRDEDYDMFDSVNNMIKGILYSLSFWVAVGIAGYWVITSL